VFKNRHLPLDSLSLSKQKLVIASKMLLNSSICYAKIFGMPIASQLPRLLKDGKIQSRHDDFQPIALRGWVHEAATRYHIQLIDQQSERRPVVHLATIPQACPADHMRHFPGPRHSG
jgi:hypothetical protein